MRNLVMTKKINNHLLPVHRHPAAGRKLGRAAGHGRPPLLYRADHRLDELGEVADTACAVEQAVFGMDM